MRVTVLAACALAACAAPSARMDDAPATLAAAETAFAAHSVREDMRAAFLAHFADDGVFVREGWRISNDFLRDRPAPAIVLDWRPQYVEVAASGELGLSTGPSKITSREKPGTPAAYGQFVSVWRRAPGGPWKVEVDLGINHAEPALWDAPLQARTVPEAPAATAGIAEAEAEFQRIAAARGTPAAYEALGAVDLRFYRPGHAPRLSRASAKLLLGSADEGLRWTSERIETSRAGDLGYARGSYASASAPDQPAGWYLRVWRREPGGWRVALDVVNPARR